jgi:D-alanyl-D-alanine carboxypeptidase
MTVDSVGVGDVATGRPIAPDDTVRIASVSKAFNGAVALSLVTQKKLSLTDTIGRLLPFLPKSWAPVTLAELLHQPAVYRTTSTAPPSWTCSGPIPTPSSPRSNC